jgi:hypothetical protein
MDIWGEVEEDYKKEFKRQIALGKEANNADWLALQYCVSKINSYGDKENIIGQALGRIFKTHNTLRQTEQFLKDVNVKSYKRGN